MSVIFRREELRLRPPSEEREPAPVIDARARLGTIAETVRAWRAPVAPADKLVLLALAETQGDDFERIADLTGMDLFDLGRAVDRLVEEGYLVVKGPPRAERRRRRTIPGATRKAVMERDQYRCRQCGSWKDLQLDHVIPHSRRGSDDESNLQVLCGSCNRKKSDAI